MPDDDYIVPIGKAEVKRPGDDLTIIAYGMMLHESLKAAETLAGEGISAEVLDLRTLSPLDKPAILESVKKTGKALIVHEDNLTGGLGGEVAAMIAQEAFEYLDGPITRLAAPDVPAMPFSHPLQDFFLPNAEQDRRRRAQTGGLLGLPGLQLEYPCPPKSSCRNSANQ